MNAVSFPPAAAALPIRFVIYYPASPESARTDVRVLESAVVRILCERFGGVTAYPATGTFAMASGVPKAEPVTVLETYCEREAWLRELDGVGKMARLLAWLLNQEALGCSVDGKMVMIDAETEAPSMNERMSSFEEIHAYLNALFNEGEAQATGDEG
jgi:hypothetical protein